MMCDEMQGFLLAMPLSADAFGVMLEQGEVSA
jgi:EAL domain-containing protein (putative c-di-GMP-specific phosphodiesterase class I)